ncbi:hypothetical protein BaRGS_00014347, partial [Batillaria attramentaria]
MKPRGIPSRRRRATTRCHPENSSSIVFSRDPVETERSAEAEIMEINIVSPQGDHSVGLRLRLIVNACSAPL